jgi:hypothetical protein
LQAFLEGCEGVSSPPTYNLRHAKAHSWNNYHKRGTRRHGDEAMFGGDDGDEAKLKVKQTMENSGGT